MSLHLEKEAPRQSTFIHNLLRLLFYSAPQLPKDIDLSGKTAVVTGSNVGLGLECARYFLKFRLSRLIMAVRSSERGEATATDLRSQFPDADIQVWILDLESFVSVQAFAARCGNELDRIDIAVLNAAMTSLTFQRSQCSPGRELNIQVNYLGTALLALLLLPKLKPIATSATPGRLTFISSDGALGIRIKDPPENVSVLESLENPDDYDGTNQYYTSKLLLTMFGVKLAELVSPEDVIINCCNPALSKGTEFFRLFNTWPLKVLTLTILPALGRPATEAAKAHVHASLVLGEESHGSFTDWQIRAWPATMYTDEGRIVSGKVWDETLKELEFVGPEVILGIAKKP